MDTRTANREASQVGLGVIEERICALARYNAELGTSEDLRYVRAEGATAGRGTRQLHKYMDHMLRAATRSVAVRRRFLEAQGMLKGPGVIFSPSVVMRVAKQALVGNS